MDTVKEPTLQDVWKTGIKLTWLATGSAGQARSFLEDELLYTITEALNREGYGRWVAEVIAEEE